MRVAVIGSGYVGLVAGTCLATLGHQVALVDSDRGKVDSLKAGAVPIHEQFLRELIARNVEEGRLTFSDSLPGAVRRSTIIFIAVGTPAMENGDPDLSFVEEVASVVAKHVDEYKVIVEKSTVPVLTHEQIRWVMMLNGAAKDSFDVVSNPEFLREGTAVQDFLYPDRIVVGADNDASAAILSDLYEPLIGGGYYRQSDAIPAPTGYSGPPRFILTSAKSAELIKHASNAFLAMKISFINAVANVCEAVGADAREVSEGVGADRRIGSSFLRPGIGFGGSCFPKDLLAFRLVARECGVNFDLLDKVAEINEEQRTRFVRKVRNCLWTLRGKRLAALGLAFKGGTDDIRESPAIAIIEALLEEGAEVVAFDPAAMDRATAVFGNRISYVDTAYEACHDAHALLILTDWPEFSGLDLGRVRRELHHPIVIDGRNMFGPEDMAAAGFHYYSIGRPAVSAVLPVANRDVSPAQVLPLGHQLGNDRVAPVVT
jgi:UDPglucose 6-dehydrogenase